MIQCWKVSKYDRELLRTNDQCGDSQTCTFRWSLINYMMKAFLSQWQKEGNFVYSARSSLESFNPHPLFADSVQHCSSQSYGLCLHHRAEALCWIQSPSAPRLPAWLGLALSRRTVSLPHHFFLPSTNDRRSFKIKALAKQQFLLPSVQKYSIWRTAPLVGGCLPI